MTPEFAVGFDKFTHDGASVGPWIPESGDRPSRFAQAGGRKGARPPCSIKRGLGSIHLKFGFQGIELDDESAQTVRENVMQIPGYSASFLKSRGPAPFLGGRQAVLECGTFGGV